MHVYKLGALPEINYRRGVIKIEIVYIFQRTSVYPRIEWERLRAREDRERGKERMSERGRER